MAEPFTLDASDWPLIINRGDEVIAEFGLPEHGGATEEQEQIKRANDVVTFLNQRVLPAGYPAGWPRCACGEPALDGHLTCGRLGCSESAARVARGELYRG